MVTAAKPRFDPIWQAPIGHRIVVVTATNAWPPYIEGELVGVTFGANIVEWLIRDDNWERWAIPWGDIRRWDFDDVRLAEEQTMDLTQHIRAFCWEESGNYSLELPWRWNGLVVATDARALVACDPKFYSGPLAEDDAKVPKIDPILAPHEKVKRWEALPPKITDCDFCQGTGMRTATCECGGNPDLFPCEACGRTGRRLIVCGSCAVSFRRRRIGRAQFNRIKPLPGCKWGTVPRSGPEDVVFFCFDGGYGVVNPLAK